MSLRENRLYYTIKKYGILGLVIALAMSMGIYWLGLELMLWIAAISVGFILIMPKTSFRLLMQWRGGKKVNAVNFPELFQMVYNLTHQAGLKNIPDIYLLPQRSLNAFASGSDREPFIGITRGLIDYLDDRQLYGVLAHEISHIKNKDLEVKKFAGFLGSITNNLSFIGRLLLLFNLPLYLMGMEMLPWMAILMLVFAPVLNMLLQMGLSRSMEYMADADAASLTGDPFGLASALKKIDAAQKRWLFGLGYKINGSSWLSSHPETRLRVEKLLKLVPAAPQRWPNLGYRPGWNPF